MTKSKLLILLEALRPFADGKDLEMLDAIIDLIKAMEEANVAER